MYCDLKKYITKTLLLTIPFIVFVIVYVFIDPFLVIRQYDNYYQSRKGPYSLNQGLVGTRNFINHYAQYQWNSFLLGNSRSRYWRIEDWEEVLGQGNRGYHFDAHAESLLGIVRKVQFLDDNGADIKNALLVIDKSVLMQTESSNEHVFIIPPELDNYSNLLLFHYVNFSAFADHKFLKKILKKKDTPTIEDLITGEFSDYDYTKNEISQSIIEDKIKKGEYYSQYLYKMVFEGKQYPNYPSPAFIKDKHIEMLNEICRIFHKHNTNCKIVISPLFDQSKLNSEDIRILKRIFGDNNVFDYSGVNEYSNDYHNYYESSHYRPLVTAKIIKDIYSIESN